MVRTTCPSSEGTRSRLIGAPGYVGYDEAGGLYWAAPPLRVVLFDEVEKAP